MNGGQLKTGIDFDDSPITGGTAGLITNALGTDVTVLFDSIVLGPLEVETRYLYGFMLKEGISCYSISVTGATCERVFRLW